MDSTLSFFSLPFVDSESADLVLNKNPKEEYPDCGYDEPYTSLPPHGSLLGHDDVLAQFLSPDEPLEEPDLNGPTTLHCEICQKKFDNAKKYYGHLRIHSKGNAWVCDKCPDQKFATKQHLMKHSLTHKPLDRMWRCQHCSLSFEALWRLQQHLFSTHLEYKPHKCDECEKSFHKKSDLKRHKDVHSKINRFSCSVCGVEFRENSNFRRHMQRHTKEKPYCCTGCGSRYTQLASLKRHAVKCPKNPIKVDANPTVRKNHCRVCGMTFQYKSALLEHCVRQHTNSSNPSSATTEKINDKTQVQLMIDHNRTVDNIVDDILSAEDDYLTMSTQNEILNVYNQNQNVIQDNNENLMQVEFLKAMNQLHSLDDELFYNDLDLDNFQASHIFNMNTNDMDYGDKNGEILFDFADNGRSMDQDIMNVLSDVAPITETNKTEPVKNPPVSVNECATIFESDVDLEASTNLAANLNQLIGENNVHYVSTEDDDTFIISLNSAIDAEQLTDMLNIGVELIENNNEEITELPELDKSDHEIDDPIVVKIEKPVLSKEVSSDKENADGKPKVKKCTLFVCRACNKVFKKKDNYKSHKATHDPSLRSHRCRKCDLHFSYRSTLNKHRAKHGLKTKTTRQFKCERENCEKVYDAAWKLKNHVERDHEKLAPYKCDRQHCGKTFYKHCDLLKHERYHSGERPFTCDICQRAFQQISHLKRHVRNVDCTRHVQQ